MTRTRRWYFPNFRFSFQHKIAFAWLWRFVEIKTCPMRKFYLTREWLPALIVMSYMLIRSCVRMYIKMITSHLHDNFSKSLYHFLLLVLWFVYLHCRNLATVKVAKVRYSVWSADMNFVALFSKHGKFWSHTLTSCLSAYP